MSKRFMMIYDDGIICFSGYNKLSNFSDLLKRRAATLDMKLTALADSDGTNIYLVAL